MSHFKRVCALAIGLAMLAVLAGPALAADATVGHLIRGIAQQKNLNATDARVAADSLRAIGYRLAADLDLNKRLTEQDVATISRTVGLRVTTSNPDAYFSAEKLDRFLNSFGGELVENHPWSDDDCAPGEDCTNPGQGGGPPFDPFTRTRGKPKGKAKFRRTPSEPE